MSGWAGGWTDCVGRTRLRDAFMNFLTCAWRRESFYLASAGEAFPRAGWRHRSTAASQRLPGAQGTPDRGAEIEAQ